MDKWKCHYPEDINTSEWFTKRPMRTQDKDTIVRAFQIINSVYSEMRDNSKNRIVEYERTLKLKQAMADFMEHDIGIYTMDAVGTIGFRRYIYAYPAMWVDQNSHNKNLSSYRIKFLDFPDILINEPTKWQAEQAAQKALEEKLKTLRTEGKEIPTPTPTYDMEFSKTKDLLIFKV